MELTDWIVNKYGSDKVLHFLGGALIVSILSYFGWMGVIVGTIITLVLSIIKEKYLDTMYDKVDIYGAMMGCTMSIIIYGLFSVLF